MLDIDHPAALSDRILRASERVSGPHRVAFLRSVSAGRGLAPEALAKLLGLACPELELTGAATAMGHPGPCRPGAAPLLPPVLFGRYALGPLLGSGGFGTVYRGIDLPAGHAVAIKLVAHGSPAETRRFERERSAHRQLFLPGVVPILAEGPVGGFGVIVMPFVAGRPFPGLLPEGPGAEAALGARVSELLSIVRRLHAVGVVHGDVKPANVLVGDAGEVTLLDLGVACRERDARRTHGSAAGTRGFIAPEVLAGSEPTGAADLFAVGVCVRRTLGDCEHAPLHALAVGLTDPDPALRERHAAAWTAPQLAQGIRALRARLAEHPTHAPLGPAGLKSLLLGLETIAPVRTEAATILYARTGGIPDLVAREVTQWVECGLAHFDAGRVRVDRKGVRRAAVFLPLLVHEATVDNPSELVSRCLAVRSCIERTPLDPKRVARLAEHLERAGDSTLALILLRTAWQRIGSDRLAPELAPALVRAALAEGDFASVAQVSWDLYAPQADATNLPDLARVCRAALRVIEGRPDRGVAILTGDRWAPWPDPVEALRLGVAAAAVQYLPLERHRAFVARVQRWGDSDDRPRRGLLARVEGWLHYREGAFREAARAQLRGAQLSGDGHAAASSLLSAANALLDAQLPTRALRVLDVLARRYGTLSTTLSRRRTWLARAAAYRAGHATPDGRQIVEELQQVRAPYDLTLIALTEAAIQWRAGEQDEAARIAGLGCEALAAREGEDLLMLLTALFCAASGSLEQPWLQDPVARAEAGGPPGLVVQAAALLSTIEGRARPRLHAAAAPCWAALRDAPWEARREVMSAAEAHHVLESGHVWQ